MAAIPFPCNGLLLRCVNIPTVLLMFFNKFARNSVLFFSIRPPPELLLVLGLLERYMTPTLDVALLCSSRAAQFYPLLQFKFSFY